MLYGLYLSAQGAQAQSSRQDVIANNVANASTPSFKRDLLRIQSSAQEDVLRGGAAGTIKALQQMMGGVSAGDVVTDFRMGPLQPTDNPLDVAVTGKGFLRVSENGQDYLTRDGRLSVATDGTLVTRDHGLPVLNVDGTPINVDPGLPLVISADGTVRQNGTAMGQLALVQPESSKDLQKAGRNLYVTEGRLLPVEASVRVLQGHLEQSGVNAVSEMVELIEASKAYEANVNMIKTQDDSLGRLLASAGRK